MDVAGAPRGAGDRQRPNRAPLKRAVDSAELRTAKDVARPLEAVGGGRRRMLDRDGGAQGVPPEVVLKLPWLEVDALEQDVAAIARHVAERHPHHLLAEGDVEAQPAETAAGTVLEQLALAGDLASAHRSREKVRNVVDHVLGRALHRGEGMRWNGLAISAAKRQQ